MRSAKRIMNLDLGFPTRLPESFFPPVAVLVWFVQYRQFSPYWATLWVVIWGAILMGLVALAGIEGGLWLD